MSKKCPHCGTSLNAISNICTICGGLSQSNKPKMIEKKHSGYSIASLTIGCIIGSIFFWLTRVIFFRIEKVSDLFAGNYIMRETISLSIDGFFLFLVVIGLILGVIGHKRIKSNLSLWAIAVNTIILVIGAYRLFVLLMAIYVF